jgi:glycerol-3-phosphate dehydrogenase subunit C
MSEQGPISYSPTPGLSYDPADPVYWDGDALAQEIERTFEICHGCRLCFKYCDSFPSLFSFIDERHDGNVRRITADETDHVMDECFQCKLCEVQCPYTVRDQHEYQLDFPKLVHRYKAQRTRDRGRVSLRDKVLGDPDRTAKLARASLGAANALNSRSKLHRKFLEKTLGIHPDKELPTFAGSTFEKWATEQGLLSDSPDEGEVVLFQTCYVQHNEPQIGRDTVEVLQKSSVEVTCEKGLQCCGMPAWESGDLETMRAKAAHNLERLEAHVDAGKKVLAVNPTCSMMLRQEYPTLVTESDRPRAEKVAAAVMDPAEFLWSIRNEERFNQDFRSSPGDTVAYHAPCHLRAQAVGFKGRDLIRRIPGVTPTTTMECCGHDGTYAMKTEGFEVSVRIGKKAFDGMQAAEDAEVWATDCPLAATQFAQHAGRRPMHPMSILARAYRPDGFPNPIPEASEDA